MMSTTTASQFLAQAGREETRFVTELRHLPEGWVAVAALAGLVALLWLVVWMYRNEGRVGASSGIRTFLAVVRCAILLTLTVILLEPVRVQILRRWIDSYTIVLVDKSSSMDLLDKYRDESAAASVKRALGVTDLTPIRRADLVAHVLQQDNRKFLTDLADNNRVRLYSFDEDPRLEGTIRAAWEKESESAAAEDGVSEDYAILSGTEAIPTAFPATGSATNLERAVYRGIESLGGAPVAGIVLLTDGGFNQGAPAEDIARYARSRNVPIHVIGLGDPAPPRNVRVTEILAPQNAFQQDPFGVTVDLASEGLDGETVRLALLEKEASVRGEGRIVGTRHLTVAPGGGISSVTFQRRQDQVARYVYTARVAPVDGESVLEDNSARTTVRVIDSRTRVLLVAGGPSWDYRYVTTLLERDDTVDVSCWLQSADHSAVRDGDIVIDHLPSLAEELFEYDVVILMDPDKSEFTKAWCELADTLVSEHGGGLLFAAARPRTASFLREPSLKPLRDLLPVTLDPEADLVLNQVGHYQLSGSPIEIPQSAFAHPVLRLSDDSVSTKLAWRGIGEVYWHYPVLREKPVATVLMRHGNPRMKNSYGGHVLAAVQYVGAGRTGFLAFDSSWRWRRSSVEHYDRFWVQLVRYLSEGKLLGGSKRATLLLDNEHPALGEAVTVSARLLDSRYEPLSRDQITARYEFDGETGELTLSGRGDRPGWFEGRLVPDRVGSYRISIRLPGEAGDSPIEAEQELMVSRPNLEILRPQMNKAELIMLARRSAGGKYWELDEVADLPQAIPDLHEEVPVRSRPTTLWDNWKTLTLLILLMTIEWAVRKWNRLL